MARRPLRRPLVICLKHFRKSGFHFPAARELSAPRLRELKEGSDAILISSGLYFVSDKSSKSKSNDSFSPNIASYFVLK